MDMVKGNLQRADGMLYAPRGKARYVCNPGEFRFAVIGLDHGHIYGMCNGLLEAGGQLVYVFDPDKNKVAKFCKTYEGVKQAVSEQQILEDPSIHLVAAAPIPCERGPLGVRVMRHNKDYFCDKPPFTTFDQLREARRVCAETGRIFAVYYAERIHVEASIYAGQLIEEGAIGQVIQVLGLGPHRLNAAARPPWFWDRSKYGGILVDLGSHQIEQFLFYTKATAAKVLHSKVGNFCNQQRPDFEDFGDATLVANNGATGYFRVDWFTPDALPVWGDGRTFILGTEGYIEIRKYIDVGRNSQGDHIYVVNNKIEKHMCVSGKVGFPFFGQLILDCLNRTQTAMPQQHTFLAAELALEAQARATRITPTDRTCI